MIIALGVGACCIARGSTQSRPGIVSGLARDASFVSEAEPLLVVTSAGLTRTTLDGRQPQLLVPSSAFADYRQPTVTGHTPSWSALSLEAYGAPYLVSLDPVHVEALAPGATRGNAVFSPDGSRLAAVAIWHMRTELIVVDVATHVIRRAALGPDLWAIDAWSDDAHVVLRQWGGPVGCAIADTTTLEHPAAECPAQIAHEDPARCAEVGTIQYRARTSPGTFDAIALQDPQGHVRDLVTADGWTVPEQSSFDMSSPPDLEDFSFSSSCRYGVFRYDQRAYVVEIATGRTASLSSADGIWPMFPQP